MRSVLFFLSISLCGSICFGQIDSTKTPREPSTTTRVPIPGVDTPLSGPGTMLQSTPDPNAVVAPPNNGKKRKGKTVPPSDPRAFGVGVPIGKAKKDSL
ncbi:hypothetical protein [Spirosoma endbachense]|uniref:Uncharacterized protein n=1 Tax=Spirosoma endbachense TaxID=2666025 RepID=A0A6P1VX12_9BACT|nr:hypothetical protein [Spirosoma endbachense]QHV97174.1 hypothetical protein GJR95_20150 [Spirosoma endbachense]